MAEHNFTSEIIRVFETIRIPFVLTDSRLKLIYANQFAREALPLRLERGRKLDVENFLQREDSTEFESMMEECLREGESTRTLKQRGIDKYFKVRAYCMCDSSDALVFHFEDVSQSRIMEDQLYEHLVDLYSQLETRERELTDLRATIMRTHDVRDGHLSS